MQVSQISVDKEKPNIKIYTIISNEMVVVQHLQKEQEIKSSSEKTIKVKHKNAILQ